MLSVLLIAIPVTLILTLVGLSQGMLEDSARRSRGVGADILVRPPNSSVMNFNAASMPQNPWQARCAAIPVSSHEIPAKNRELVSRFRNSHDLDIGLRANFGIEGH